MLRRHRYQWSFSNIYGLVGLVLLLVNWSTMTEAAEFCLAEAFNASCSSDEFLLMTSALYGRMRSNRCIKSDYGHVGCQADVSGFVDDECSGRQHCHFQVAKLLSVATPCPTDVTSYLELSYTCVKAASAASRCSSDGYIALSDTQDGYIPLSKPVAGARPCRWKITVDPNQRIEFTVLAFGYRQLQQPDAAAGHCPWSVVFKEGTNDVEESLCRTSGRQVVFYTSTTNTVTTYLHHKHSGGQLSGIYILKYEAVGCPQLKVSDNVWVQQDGRTAKVKCNSTEETWFLACNGRRWAGELGNCSTASQAGAAMRDNVSTTSAAGSLPYGFVVAVIIGVILGVVIGAIPLGLVYLCLKRKWKRQPPVYMHDAGFYPDLQHVVQADDDVVTRSCSMYPALLKPAGKSPVDSSPAVHCCTAGQIYNDNYQRTTTNFGSPGSDPVESPWEGRHPTRPLSPPAHCYRMAPDCPIATTVVASDGTLLRSTLCPAGHVRHDHVYESASFARSCCRPYDEHADMAGSELSDNREQNALHAPSIVYYEVDACDKTETRPPRTVDVLPKCRAQQSVI